MMWNCFRVAMCFPDKLIEVLMSDEVAHKGLDLMNGKTRSHCLQHA